MATSIIPTCTLLEREREREREGPFPLFSQFFCFTFLDSFSFSSSLLRWVHMGAVSKSFIGGIHRVLLNCMDWLKETSGHFFKAFVCLMETSLVLSSLKNKTTKSQKNFITEHRRWQLEFETGKLNSKESQSRDWRRKEMQGPYTQKSKHNC